LYRIWWLKQGKPKISLLKWN